MVLEALTGKNVLLLQGPVGFFFKNFAEDLAAIGAQVFKINFNGGDHFFYKEGVSYYGSLTNFAAFVQNFVKKNNIHSVMLFGDCRPIHVQARKALAGFPLEWYVFEEGYLRPNHITCEREGVNGHSQLPEKARKYLKNYGQEQSLSSDVVEVGRTFWYAAYWAVLYYLFASFYHYQYRHYQHHRPLTLREAWPWLKSGYRKYVFKLKELGVEQYLLEQKSKQYFLVPLQTHNDAQIHFHSPYQSIEQFIEEVMTSFAQHAPKDVLLVLKQHPFDRGYKDYTRLIEQLSQKLEIQARVFYIHDQYLPKLLENSRGVIVINSTVGMSAVESLIPVKVCGTAVYDIEKMTLQCDLNQFWTRAESWRVNKNIVKKYMYYLQHTTQFNGSFYRKIQQTDNYSGVIWSQRIALSVENKNVHSIHSLLNVK